MMTHWPSPAKLNLFLYITGQRADGYHTLQTLFQFVDYGDTISIEPRQDGQICLLTPVDGVAHDDNLIVREAVRISVSTNACRWAAVLAAVRQMLQPFWWRLTICGVAV